MIAAMKNCIVLLLAVAATLAAALGNPTVIGNGWGLDHVIVGVSNPEVAKQIFGTKLGFTPFTGSKFPAEGLDQAIIELSPAYIELLWPYREPAADARPIASRVRKKVELGGGPVTYNIDVSPVEQAVDAMRRIGMRVSLRPGPTTKTPDGKEAPDWQFADIDPQDKTAQPLGVPGGLGVGFLEYRINSNLLNPDRFKRLLERAEREVPDPRRTSGEIHANTARRLRSVWIAVPSVVEAVKQAGRFEFAAGVERQFKALGEKGREVQCGQGTLVFFEPVHEHSPLAALVDKQGFGLFGISIGVADLKTAQRIVQQGTQVKFRIQRLGNQASFVVPSDLAGGTFLEFVQE
jgi:hypothetical protein